MTKKVKTTKFFNSGVTAIISISLVLFLVGMIVSLLLITSQVSNQIKEEIGFSVALTDSITTEELADLQNYIQKAPYIKSFEYVSKEQALKKMTSQMGENPDKFLGYNPLAASFEVKTKSEFANPASIDNIKKGITQKQGVKDFFYQKETIDAANENIHNISIGLGVIACIMLFLSIGMINTTIRLQVYSKRFLINTMKLVGARSWFIRSPFIRQGFISGIIAAIIAGLILTPILYYVQFFALPTVSLWNFPTMSLIFGAMLILGLIISVVSTIFAVDKYLRIKTNDLYYI